MGAGEDQAAERKAERERAAALLGDLAAVAYEGPVPAVISPECLAGNCGICDEKNPADSEVTNPCEHNCHTPAYAMIRGAEAELGAMGDMYEILVRCSHPAQKRIIAWLQSSFGLYEGEPF